MNKKLIVGIFVAILVIVVVALVWFFASSSTQAPPSTASTTPPVTLPISGPVQTPVGTATSSNPTGTMTIAAKTGGPITTEDFIDNGVTLPDAANKGRYALAGDLGYCISDPSDCQAGTETDFSVFYDANYSSFTIALLKEPLGQVRLEAEQFLLNELGITQSDMCRLNYYVGTTFDVNTAYSVKNLGFSFCPGATVLPQ